jgi:hypothetical protein
MGYSRPDMKITPTVELRNGCADEPHAEEPRGRAASRSTLQLFSLVCPSWNVPFDKLRAGFRGRFAAP